MCDTRRYIRKETGEGDDDVDSVSVVEIYQRNVRTAGLLNVNGLQGYGSGTNGVRGGADNTG